MRVEVSLFATLAAYLPPDAAGDRVVLDVPAGSTVRQVVRSFAIPAQYEFVTVVNGLDVPPEHVLVDGDALTLFPPLAGGR